MNKLTNYKINFNNGCISFYMMTAHETAKNKANNELNLMSYLVLKDSKWILVMKLNLKI